MFRQAWKLVPRGARSYNPVLPKRMLSSGKGQLFQPSISPWKKLGAFTGGLVLVTFGTLSALNSKNEKYSLPVKQDSNQKKKDQMKELKKNISKCGEVCKSMPTFTNDDISKHTTAENGIWVSYKCGVYDITEFIGSHPGGGKILLAAGKSIAPYWDLYAAHNHEHVYELIEDYRIGNLCEADIKANAESQKNKAGPYENDPIRNPVLVVNSAEPFNAETPDILVTNSQITPSEIFFVRNHLPVPQVTNVKDYKLEVVVPGKKTLELGLDDLKKFPQHTITSTLQCAGNRRSEMSEAKLVKGLSWKKGAISNATWTGVYLRDVLREAGFDDDNSPEIEHVQFEGLDTEVDGKFYGASIPVQKAMDKNGDVLIALQMNGEDIPADHGFPLRAIVPGHVGARNVKWLKRIVAGAEQSLSFWQQRDYRSFPPGSDYSNFSWDDAGPAIQEMPIQSAICEPSQGATLSEDDEVMTVKGYAYSGGGRSVIRVDVSIDEGKTWQTAELHPKENVKAGRDWEWTLWTAEIDLPEEHPAHGELTVICKALDSSYNCQPESVEPIWNMRGLLNNSWHRVSVNIPSSVYRIYRRPSLKQKQKFDE